MNMAVVTGLTVLTLALLGLLLLSDRRREREQPLSGYRQALKSLRGFRRAEGLDPFPHIDHRPRVYRRGQPRPGGTARTADSDRP